MIDFMHTASEGGLLIHYILLNPPGIRLALTNIPLNPPGIRLALTNIPLNPPSKGDFIERILLL